MALDRNTSETYRNSILLVLGQVMILCFLGSPGLGYLTMGSKLFSWTVPVLWNHLPSKVRICPSVAALRSQL